MASAALVKFRDRFGLPLTDEQLAELPFLRFDEDSEELAYLRERRTALGGYLPSRRQKSTQSLPVPELSAFGGQLGGTPGRQISTTMAFVRILNTLLRDKAIGPRVVPIVPDESRTFGMEGMFRQFGIPGGSGPRRPWPCPTCPRSAASWAAPRAGRSPPRWRSSGS